MNEVARNIADDTAAEIEQQHTRLVHLVEIAFPSGSEYLSEAGAINFNGHEFVEGGVAVDQFTWSTDGTQQGNIILQNEANAAVAVVLNNGIADVPVTIWQTYLRPDGTHTTPVIVVAGVCDSADIEPDVVTIGVLTSKASTSFVPHEYHTPANGFNHLPVPGTVVQWNNETYVLEAEAGY